MRDLSTYISTRANAVDASGIRKVFDLAAKLKDPINLSIGLPDFDVPDVVKTAAIDAIKAGHNRYTQTQGIAPLRERIRRDLSAEMGRDVGEILITSGVSGGLFLALLATIDPGVEEAITPRTKLLILNSPSNPTGVVMTEAEVAAAVAIARRHDLLLISDEIYEPFLYEG